MQALQRLRPHRSAADAAPQGGDRHYVTLTIAVWREEGHWLSECLELGIGSFGDTEQDAAEQAMDATCAYLNTLEQLGERERVFAERSIPMYIGEPAERHLPTLSREVAHRSELQLRPFEFPVAGLV